MNTERYAKVVTKYCVDIVAGPSWYVKDEESARKVVDSLRVTHKNVGLSEITEYIDKSGKIVGRYIKPLQ